MNVLILKWYCFRPFFRLLPKSYLFAFLVIRVWAFMRNWLHRLAANMSISENWSFILSTLTEFKLLPVLTILHIKLIKCLNQIFTQTGTTRANNSLITKMDLSISLTERFHFRTFDRKVYKSCWSTICTLNQSKCITNIIHYWCSFGIGNPTSPVEKLKKLISCFSYFASDVS